MAVLAQTNDKILFPLSNSKTKIGRGKDNDICVDGQEVSTAHALIEQLKNHLGVMEYFIEDLGSTNQTFVNGKAISERVKLIDDDEVRIGWVVLKFLDDTNPNYAKTSKIYKSWIPGVYYTK